MARRENLYGDGQAGARIAALLSARHGAEASA
jgi:hypothetical protein